MALRLAIDTNAYVDFARGTEAVLEPMRRAERIFVPFVVIEHGLHLLARDAHFDHLPQIPRP